MKSRLLLPVFAMGLALGCQPAPKSSAGSTAPTASVSSATPVEVTSATGTQATGPSRSTLSRLPPGAAAYAVARLSVLDDFMAVLPSPDRLRREFTPLLGSQASFAEGFAKLGLAADQPIAIALMAPDLARAREIIDAAAKGAPPPQGASGAPPVMAFVRVVMALRPGADPRSVSGGVSKVAHDAEPLRCPEDAACSALGGSDLVAAWRGPAALMSLRVDGPFATLDIALPLFDDADEATIAKALAAFSNGPTKGPSQGECTDLDASAGLSACVHADRFAAFGTAQGFAQTLKATAGAKLAALDALRIIETGRGEALRAVELANPQRRLLDDGTFSVNLVSSKIALRASWALTDNSRDPIKRAFPSERCSAGDVVLDELARPLAKAFGDPGPDFKDLKEQEIHVREAGWSAYPVLFARTWPNLLPGAVVLLSDESGVGRRTEEVCVDVNKGRLVVRARLRP